MACWVQKKRGSGSSIFLLDSKQKRQPIESKECIREVVRICTYLAWLWLFTFPCSFILVSCCLLLFYKGATAKDESVHITRAVLAINFWQQCYSNFKTGIANKHKPKMKKNEHNIISIEYKLYVYININVDDAAKNNCLSRV